jgi:hypothetical protein
MLTKWRSSSLHIGCSIADGKLSGNRFPNLSIFLASIYLNLLMSVLLAFDPTRPLSVGPAQLAIGPCRNMRFKSMEYTVCFVGRRGELWSDAR